MDEAVLTSMTRNKSLIGSPYLPMELIFKSGVDSVYIQNGTFESGVNSIRRKSANELEVNLFGTDAPTYLKFQDDHITFRDPRSGKDFTFVRIQGDVADRETGSVMPNFLLKELLAGTYRVTGYHKTEKVATPLFTIYPNGQAKGLSATHVQLILGGDLQPNGMDGLALIHKAEQTVRHFGWRMNGQQLLLFYLLPAGKQGEKPVYLPGQVAFVLEKQS